MTDKVKGFISKGLLAEFHLQEIIQLSAADNLSPWLTTHQAWEELAEKAVKECLSLQPAPAGLDTKRDWKGD